MVNVKGVMTMGVHPILLTALAGLSTGLGGLAAVFFRPTERLLAFCSGFAASVMITVSLADLLPEALAEFGAVLGPVLCGPAVTLLMLGGMVAAGFLERALPEEELLARRFGSRRQGAAMRTALVTGAALLLHNLPEGVLTLVSGAADSGMGARTAMAVALHNIPEGLAVAVPFACATGSRLFGLAAALASGLAEPAGALLAWIFLRGRINAVTVSGIIVPVAGIMLWVSVEQLLPAAFPEGNRRAGSLGCAVGILVMILGIAGLT